MLLSAHAAGRFEGVSISMWSSYQSQWLSLLTAQCNVYCGQFPSCSGRLCCQSSEYYWSVKCSFQSCLPGICNEGLLSVTRCHTQTRWCHHKFHGWHTRGLWWPSEELVSHPEWKSSVVWRCRGGRQSILLQHKQVLDSLQLQQQHLEITEWW